MAKHKSMRISRVEAVDLSHDGIVLTARIVVTDGPPILVDVRDQKVRVGGRLVFHIESLSAPEE
jgi:hypothetical protein